MKKELLTELIEDLCAFSGENEGHDYTMQDFIGYLNAKKGFANRDMSAMHGKKGNSFTDIYRNNASDISILLVLMYRYARGYTKKALRDSLLQTADEFSFLITLMTFESLIKSDLINKQIMEKTSGSEVIRRLKKNGLITESDDFADRRSIRVSITEKGRNEIRKILPAMSDVSNIIVGNLEKEEVNTLLYLLKKLDHFHNYLYTNNRKTPLWEIKALDIKKG